MFLCGLIFSFIFPRNVSRKRDASDATGAAEPQQDVDIRFRHHIYDEIPDIIPTQHHGYEQVHFALVYCSAAAFLTD